MKYNVGGADRTLRMVGGVVLALGALLLPVDLGWRGWRWVFSLSSRSGQRL